MGKTKMKPKKAKSAKDKKGKKHKHRKPKLPLCSVAGCHRSGERYLLGGAGGALLCNKHCSLAIRAGAAKPPCTGRKRKERKRRCFVRIGSR